jgi:hypothetical protein
MVDVRDGSFVDGQKQGVYLYSAPGHVAQHRYATNLHVLGIHVLGIHVWDTWAYLKVTRALTLFLPL